MENSYIELLETLQLENNEIGAIQKFIVDHNIDNVAYRQIETIITLFRMCNVPDNKIGKFIHKNLSMLVMSHMELLKIVYVWDITGTLNSIEKNYYLRIPQLNRTFLRYQFLTSGNTYRTPTISYEVLISGDVRFVEKHSAEINKEPFAVSYENLLNYYFQEDMSLEEKEEKLSQKILSKSRMWYFKKLSQQKNKVK